MQQQQQAAGAHISCANDAEDRLRQELQVRRQQEAIAREMKQKAEQARAALIAVQKELKGQDYTYDSSGKLVLLHKVDPEHLPAPPAPQFKVHTPAAAAEADAAGKQGSASSSLSSTSRSLAGIGRKGSSSSSTGNGKIRGRQTRTAAAAAAAAAAGVQRQPASPDVNLVLVSAADWGAVGSSGYIPPAGAPLAVHKPSNKQIEEECECTQQQQRRVVVRFKSDDAPVYQEKEIPIKSKDTKLSEEQLKEVFNKEEGNVSSRMAELRADMGKAGSDLTTMQTFDGPGPETINGRLAMLAVATGLAGEYFTGLGLSEQTADHPLAVFASFVIISIATYAPIFRGYTRKEPFANHFLGLNWSPKAENWNGRWVV
ncbi:hypothetical protein COO60DRAFT_1701362 [Scenedesmus sp. NREL 46B-D3]|nr:hypothetical protein COO60DRAFT_1701362 [Scenedesmus sp. NREL 46B-D3]